MCNSCNCDYVEKCSNKGNAPFGFCCFQCNNYNPLDLPCANQFEASKTREFLVLKDLVLIEKIV